MNICTSEAFRQYKMCILSRMYRFWHKLRRQKFHCFEAKQDLHSFFKIDRYCNICLYKKIIFPVLSSFVYYGLYITVLCVVHWLQSCDPIFCLQWRKSQSNAGRPYFYEEDGDQTAWQLPEVKHWGFNYSKV